MLNNVLNKDGNIDHTLGDALKNIKSISDSLKYFISNFKNDSLESIQEVHLFWVQVIQKKITLVQSSLSKNAAWPHRSTDLSRYINSTYVV